MTAYELAEKLTDCLGNNERWEIRALASDMLRKQADQIKKLETKYQQEFDYIEKLLKERK
mgnify:CR=1 FL=1